MTAKELRLTDEGIEVMGFGTPKRPAVERARQQCSTCHVDCATACPTECDTHCIGDCIDQCVGDPTIQLGYVSRPKAVTNSTASSRASSMYNAVDM